MSLIVRAEWLKMTGNRWLVGCLIWIWPLAALAIAGLLWVSVLLSPPTRDALIENPQQWTDASLLVWTVPNSIIGRLLIVGFTTVLFAGEYQWGTWKNMLMRRDRMTLILTKFITLATFIIIAFGLTSIIWVVGLGLVQFTASGTYPPALDNIPPDYVWRLGLQIFNAFVSSLIIAGIAALAALLTRSILASLVLGVSATLIDGFIAAGLVILYAYTDIRVFPSLYRFSISYNVDNLLNWANFQASTNVMGNIELRDNPVFGDLMISPPLEGNALWVSMVLLLAWMGILVGLAIFSFNRQDLDT
ncbi:MAG: ABC transporter permease [Anaerolineales bacterium]